MVCVTVVSKCAHAASSRQCAPLSEECAEGRAGVGVSPFPGSEWSRAVQPGHLPGKVSTQVVCFPVWDPPGQGHRTPEPRVGVGCAALASSRQQQRRWGGTVSGGGGGGEDRGEGGSR